MFKRSFIVKCCNNFVLWLGGCALAESMFDASTKHTWVMLFGAVLVWLQAEIWALPEKK